MEPLGEYVEDAPQEYEGGTVAMEPVPVLNVSERRTPEKVSCMTWNIPQNTVGQPVQILQRRRHRFKAKITLLTVTPNTATIVLSPKIDTVQGANPQGVTYGGNATTAVPVFLPDWESEQPCYVTCVGGVAVVSVQDEAFHGS